MPIVDVSFVLSGSMLPADHGYALYGALSRILPALHPPREGACQYGNDDALWRNIAIHPVNGTLVGNRMLALSPHSRVQFRIPSERVGEILPLAGKHIDVDGSSVILGVPQMYALIPAPSLRCRMAVIKGALEPEQFLETAQKSLVGLGIQGKATLVPRAVGASKEGRFSGTEGRSPWIRRTLRVQDKTVVGYALTVSELTAEESITLQEKGLGGRRRFGCGIFVPVKE